MNKIRINLPDCIRELIRQCWLVLLVCLTTCSAHSQYNIDIVKKDVVNFCDPIRYTLDIEKLFNTTLNDLVLEISFSEDVEYISNDLDLELKESTDRKIVFDYPDLQNCNLQRGDILIQPKCYDAFTTLHTSFTLKTPFVCLSESEEIAIIKSPFVDVQFSDYSYNASSNQLQKTIRLFNAGSVDIDQFYILPIADQQFAAVASSTIGRMSGDTIFIEDESLNSNDSMSLDLVFALQNCDLRSISYELGFVCAVSSCASTQQFVDENEFYNNIVSSDLDVTTGVFQNTIDFGLCEPFGTTASIRNLQDIQHTSIGDIYNLSYAVSPFAIGRRRFEECMDVSAQIGGVAIRVTTDSSTEYIIELQSLTLDPDGAGGLDDLDGDGEYDDLALGDSTSFDLQLMLKEDCHDNYQSLSAGFDTELRFSNYCNQESNRLNGSIDGGFSSGSEIANYFSGSIPSIEALQRDQNNKRFIPEGDRLLFTYNVRPSANMTRICESNELELIVDVPPTVVWDNSVDILYFDSNDTIVLSPQITNDTLMRFSFLELDSVRSSIEIQFLSVCDLNNTNYDAALPVCEQCVEYDLPKFRTQLSKPCVIDCSVPIPIWESVSAPFYTKCESLPELIEPLVLGPIEYFNLTPGFIDETETRKRNPFENPSSLNNRFYYDGDTMLVRIPFEFECADELNAFSIQLTENQLSTYEFNIISSDVVLINTTDNSELNRCPANLFVSQSETAISLDFSESSFNLPCLEVDGSHFIDLKIVFTYDCELNANCGLLRLGILQGITNVRLKNDCTRQVFYSQDTVYIHEVFKEEFFRPTDFVFGPQSVEIFDQFVIKTPLYSGLLNKKEFEPEFRRRPILRSINYTIPEGFELASDFLIVSSDFFFINGNIQLLDDSRKTDTLIHVVPQGVRNADGSMSYSFSDTDINYYSDQLGDPITAGLLIKSVCNPSLDIQNIVVDGVVEYVDYANGSLDTITYPFSETHALIFSPEVFVVEDDFQVIDSVASASWNINKTVDFFSFDNFISEDKRKTDEFRYYLKYQSKQMRIDSVTSFNVVSQFPFDNIQEQIPVTNTFIGDSIIEIEISPSFVIGADEDTFYNTQKPTKFVFHTSNHSCGFDSLFFELGRKAEFLKDTCSRDIFSDLFVTYSPPGFPQLEWIAIPAEVNTIGDNQFNFRLSNIGQGDLVENKIVFYNLPSADYSLFRIDSQGQLEDISEAIEITDSVTLNLSLINQTSLPGLSALDLSSMEFRLVFRDVCVNDKLFNISVKAISQSYCGDAVESPLLFSKSIPFIGEDNLKLEISLNSLTANQCLDTASVRIVIRPSTAQDLENPGLRLLVPKDLDSYSGTLKVNGVSLADPASELSDDKLSNIFIITDGLPTSISDSVMIELKFDGSCIDVCRVDSISAFLLSNLDQQCFDGNVSSQLVTRAYQTDKRIRWKPNISLDNINTRILDSNQDKLNFELSGDIVLTENPIYVGDVSVTIFGDLNQNTILDPTDVIVKQDLLSHSEFSNQAYRLHDTLLIEPSVICALHIIVDVDESCSCLFTRMPLNQNGSYRTTREIQNCNPDSIEVSAFMFGECLPSLASNTPIINERDGIVVFETDLSLPTDTIRFLTDCQNCQFVEEIIIQNEESDVDIILASDSDCALTAQVLWNGEEDIPDNLAILWSTTNEQTSIISDLPAGLLSVELTNESGCTYMDTISISSSDIFMYELLFDELNCMSDFPAIVDVVAQGIDPITIQWNDGMDVFQRQDIMPGSYQFTLTEGNGCTLTDTIEFLMPSDLTVQSIVSDTDCNNSTAGSIELLSNDPTVEYSLTGQSFSSQNIFTELSHGPYTIYIQNEMGCIDSIREQILLDTTFQLSIPLSQNGVFGDTIDLNPEGLDDEQYLWQWESIDFDLSCHDCAEPQIQLVKEGTVFLAVNNGTCSFNRLIRISADYSDLIYVPNAFSPNSAGDNDRFLVHPNDSFDEMDLAIFDRWGNEVYAALKLNIKDDEIGWDGKVNGKTAQVGVYVYKAIVRRFADELEIELLGDFLLVN